MTKQIQKMATRKRNIAAVCVVGLMASVLGGCSQTVEEAQTEDLAGQAGLALTVDTLADTDVARIQYTITAVDCGSGDLIDPLFEQVEVRDLENLVLPGGNTDLENNPLDANSQHLFADAFFWLDAGCYDVLVEPLQEDGSPSEDCSSDSQAQVPVFDGQTTEIMLFNQCGNDAAGALDVISVINHAPQLDNVVYDPSKFTCEDTTTICATASDPDNDPLAFEWAITGPADATVASLEESVTDDGQSRSCATFQLGGAGDYEVTVIVRDQGWGEDGELKSIEALELEGDLQSRDEAVLPIHAMDEEACVIECACPEGFELSEDAELCERITEADAVFNGELLQVCNGSRNGNYGALGGRFPDGTIVPNAFFGDAFGANNGSRLNTIGIWACDENGQDPQGEANPVGEWIGFSRCLDIEQAGAYVVGIAADDYVRVRINGELVFNLEPGAPNFAAAVPYQYWWMIPANLLAGTNIIEIEAKNATGPATFGSEIYGPFAPGSVSDDASMAGLDYANNIVWSTGDQLGSDFNTGTTSGYLCEDGFALDLCGDAATCTRIERQVCE